MAAPRAVLDADTLYRRHQRNLLVWHALEGFFDLYWSASIVGEARKHLIANITISEQDPEGKADQILGRVTEAVYVSGAGGEVAEVDIAAIESLMTNDPKDRHVLAAAVACEAGTIITTNTKDFPLASTQPHAVMAKTPDEFLTSLAAVDTIDVAMSALHNHAAHHDWSVQQLLALLASEDEHGSAAIAPSYVARIEQLTGIRAIPPSQ